MTLHNSAHFFKRDNFALHHFLQPRTSQYELTGRYNWHIRLKITAASSDNQANRECVKILSTSLQNAKTNVNVVRGRTSSTKTVETHHPDPEGWKKNLELLGD